MENEKSYFHHCENFEYTDIPKMKLEEWAEKAARYDKLVRAYLKENYAFETGEIQIFSALDKLILHILETDFEYFDIVKGPDGCDEVDHYYRSLD